MDFRHADRADAEKLNVILWKDAMGDKPVPPMLKCVRRRPARTTTIAKTGPKLVAWTRRAFFPAMASSPYFSLAVLFVAALGFGLAPLGLAWLGRGCFRRPSQTRQERHLRVRPGVKGRRLGAVPLGLLPVRDHFLSSSTWKPFFCCRLRWHLRVERGGVRGHAGVCAAAGRGIGLGLGQGRADVGVKKTGIRFQEQGSVFRAELGGKQDGIDWGKAVRAK
jgi:hypothetical protein